MNTVYLIGISKKEISEIMPVFSDRIDFTQEYKINIGQHINIYYETNLNKYYYWLHNVKKYIERREIEKNFNIVWERGCYNTCIRNNNACANLTCYQSGDTALTKRRNTSCNIRWEIGRGGCCEYKTDQAD